MTKHPKVPWTQLFPELAGNTNHAMTRDSVRRQDGTRHYRVKLHFPHSRLTEVQRKLAPHGFEVTRWSWLAHRNMLRQRADECIKCVRRTAVPAR